MPGEAMQKKTSPKRGLFKSELLQILKEIDLRLTFI